MQSLGALILDVDLLGSWWHFVNDLYIVDPLSLQYFSDVLSRRSTNDPTCSCPLSRPLAGSRPRPGPRFRVGTEYRTFDG